MTSFEGQKQGMTLTYTRIVTSHVSISRKTYWWRHHQLFRLHDLQNLTSFKSCSGHEHDRCWNVARFDADHVGVFVVAEILEKIFTRFVFTEGCGIWTIRFASRFCRTIRLKCFNKYGSFTPKARHSLLPNLQNISAFLYISSLNACLVQIIQQTLSSGNEL